MMDNQAILQYFGSHFWIISLTLMVALTNVSELTADIVLADTTVYFIVRNVSPFILVFVFVYYGWRKS